MKFNILRRGSWNRVMNFKRPFSAYRLDQPWSIVRSWRRSIPNVPCSRFRTRIYACAHIFFDFKGPRWERIPISFWNLLFHCRGSLFAAVMIYNIRDTILFGENVAYNSSISSFLQTNYYYLWIRKMMKGEFIKRLRRDEYTIVYTHTHIYLNPNELKLSLQK